MKTYLFHGVRIPEGWEIGHNTTTSSAESDPICRELRFDYSELSNIGIIAHEAMHARTSEKIGATGTETAEKIESLFPERHQYHVYQETRAFVYALHVCLKRKKLDDLKDHCGLIRGCIFGNLGWTYHREAADIVYQSHLWKRVQKALKEKV